LISYYITTRRLHSEDGGSMVLRNVGILSEPRRLRLECYRLLLSIIIIIIIVIVAVIVGHQLLQEYVTIFRINLFIKQIATWFTGSDSVLTYRDVGNELLCIRFVMHSINCFATVSVM